MEYALEIRNLTKKYDGFCLDGLNFTLPNGCIMGLVGENGAGKSTTMKLILDMIRPDTGTIQVLGRDHIEASGQIKEEVGVVLDEAGYPDCLTAKQIGKIMEHTYQNWDNAVYNGYLKQLKLPSGKEFGELSRGMRMKLGIAVALSHHPRLLLLDEATSGLDPVVRDEVVDMFSEFTRDEGHSILISSHIVSDLEKLWDYIAFLHKGRLLLCEEKDVLLEQYVMLHTTAAEMAFINPVAIKGKKESAYGVEAIVRRDAVPAGKKISPIGIEELFIFMIKQQEHLSSGRK